ncbi:MULTISPECIES: type II toxin-antitoxin system YhaV family toxin [Trichocoleus]|uniref:Type II toxin-antitoxin system YhaV family toxin n=1 Tax=Trichocoleus desertorum GB2-A4 TaxID=2933944 RepID=A0ABV0JFN3_9CYAN|nr:type II toxin-antitoxin system YhaV family toxin [Trichocoleus sp. FACHB-46]MBD1865689.1 type II toxin-antitoxin system YhaV family toxin [Trichocoleus sp. FACHB-46]
MSVGQPFIVNGWNVFTHSIFLKQIEELLTQVEHLRQKDPTNFQKKNAAKRLAAIAKLAFEVIPQDPTRTEYRQGDTLGDEYKHWFRVKFFQQYRLFFRYHQKSRVIVLAWVNDDNSKRAYGSSTDAYLVFRKMLESGHPPDSWDDLLAEAEAESSRLNEVIQKLLPTEQAE